MANMPKSIRDLFGATCFDDCSVHAMDGIAVHGNAKTRIFLINLDIETFHRAGVADGEEPRHVHVAVRFPNGSYFKAGKLFFDENGEPFLLKNDAEKKALYRYFQSDNKYIPLTNIVFDGWREDVGIGQTPYSADKIILSHSVKREICTRIADKNCRFGKQLVAEWDALSEKENYIPGIEAAEPIDCDTAMKQSGIQKYATSLLGRRRAIANELGHLPSLEEAFDVYLGDLWLCYPDRAALLSKNQDAIIHTAAKFEEYRAASLAYVG